MVNTEFIMLIFVFLGIFLIAFKKETLTKFARNLFSEKESEKYVQICPKCGSEEIENNFTNIAGIAYGSPIGKSCRSCGYEGQFYIEAKKDNTKILPKIKNKLKEHNIPLQ